jgi:hypothetical protein
MIRLEGHEFDGGAETIERHRETRRILLSPKGFFEVAVTAVDPNPISRNVGGSKKRKAHDVVPVKVGLEHVIGVRLRWAVARDDTVSESAYAAAEVAQHIIGVAGIQLNARGTAAEGVRDRKIEFAVNPCPRLLSLTVAESRETGIEPRVPQNVTQRDMGQIPRAES